MNTKHVENATYDTQQSKPFIRRRRVARLAIATAACGFGLWCFFGSSLTAAERPFAGSWHDLRIDGTVTTTTFQHNRIATREDNGKVRIIGQWDLSEDGSKIFISGYDPWFRFDRGFRAAWDQFAAKARNTYRWRNKPANGWDSFAIDPRWMLHYRIEQSRAGETVLRRVVPLGCFNPRKDDARYSRTMAAAERLDEQYDPELDDAYM